MVLISVIRHNMMSNQDISSQMFQKDMQKSHTTPVSYTHLDVYKRQDYNWDNTTTPEHCLLIGGYSGDGGGAGLFSLTTCFRCCSMA